MLVVSAEGVGQEHPAEKTQNHVRREVRHHVPPGDAAYSAVVVSPSGKLVGQAQEAQNDYEKYEAKKAADAAAAVQAVAQHQLAQKDEAAVNGQYAPIEGHGEVETGVEPGVSAAGGEHEEHEHEGMSAESGEHEEHEKPWHHLEMTAKSYDEEAHEAMEKAKEARSQAKEARREAAGDPEFESKVWESADKDEDGVLSRDEFKKAVKRWGLEHHGGAMEHDHKDHKDHKEGESKEEAKEEESKEESKEESHEESEKASDGTLTFASESGEDSKNEEDVLKKEEEEEKEDAKEEVAEENHEAKGSESSADAADSPVPLLHPAVDYETEIANMREEEDVLHEFEQVVEEKEKEAGITDAQMQNASVDTTTAESMQDEVEDWSDRLMVIGGIVAMVVVCCILAREGPAHRPEKKPKPWEEEDQKQDGAGAEKTDDASPEQDEADKAAAEKAGAAAPGGAPEPAGGAPAVAGKA